MESLLSSFELGLTIASLEIELRTERYVRSSSKLVLRIDKISASKLKQKSPSILHSLVASVETAEVRFQQIGDHTAKKFASLQPLSREGEPALCTKALSLTVEVLKSSGKEERRRLAVRGCLASLQCIMTVISAVDLYKVIDKATLFMSRQDYAKEGITGIIDLFEKAQQDQSLLNAGTACFTAEDCADDDKFMSFRDSGLFNSLYQSYRQPSLVSKGSSQNASASNRDSTASAKTQELMDNLQKDFREASVDIDFQWQGLYLGVLKVHRFDTDSVFSWVSRLGKSQTLNFSSSLYGHFLLRAENFKLSYIDNEKVNCLAVGNLEVVDCIALSGEPKVDARADHSFSNRVEIEGLDSESMNSSIVNDGSAIFKSTVDFGSLTDKQYCEEHCVVRLSPIPQPEGSEKPAVVKVRFELAGIPRIAVAVHKLSVNFDMDSFKLMTDRRAMHDEIMQVCQLVSSEKKKSESESFRANESRLLFDGLIGSDFNKVVRDLDKLLAALAKPDLRQKLTDLFGVVLPSSLTQAQTVKVDVDIAHIEARVGGRIDNSANKEVFLTVRAGGLHLLSQKMILVSWRHAIEVGIETELGSYTMLKITGDKENLIGIDEQNMMVKLSALELNFSPAIFEGVMLIVQYVESKLQRLEFNHQKYQIIKSLQALIETHEKAYVLFSQELEVNARLRAVSSEIFRGPALVEKLHVYLAKLNLRIFDEEITKDIIESSIAQRKRMMADFEDWTFVEDDSQQRPFHEVAEDDIERKEDQLKKLSVVAHLELKPIMVKQNLGSHPSLLFFVHTVMLLDGMTYLAMKDCKQNYKTHFCELYSINYNQPSFDANLSKQFDIKQSVSMFRAVLRKFKDRKPFLEINQGLDYDPHHNRHLQRTEIKMSSIILRLAMQTSKETFACLIRIVDSTLLRLDAIGDLFHKLREANTSDEMRLYQEQQSERSLKNNQKKTAEVGSVVTVDLDSIYLDIFNATHYRLLLKVSSTKISIDDNPVLCHPLVMECTGTEAAFTTIRDITAKKEVDDMADKTKYFRIFKLHTMIIKTTTGLEEKVPTTNVDILLPTKKGKNLLFMIDLDSLAVLLEIFSTFSSLLAHAKQKTKYIFKDQTEYRDRMSEGPPRREQEDWEKIGLKYPEVKALRDHFDYLSDRVSESFQLDNDEPDDHETSSIKLESSLRKIEDSLRVLRNIYIEKLSENVSNLNVKLYVDKTTVNVYQQYDFVSHSYISLKIHDLMVVLRQSSSSCETSRKSEKTAITTSVIASVRSMKVLDKTRDSWFKYLLKVPRHSLCFFYRSREVAEKSVLRALNSIKPTYLVESYKDKLALVLDLNPVEVFLDDKSVSSLKQFTERLLVMLKAAQPDELVLDSHNSSAEAMDAGEAVYFLLDYIYVGKISLQLIARSATNLSIVNYIPDVNINLEVVALDGRKK